MEKRKLILQEDFELPFELDIKFASSKNNEVEINDREWVVIKKSTLDRYRNFVRENCKNV